MDATEEITRYGGNYNPVSVNVDNTIGVLVLGVLNLALLIALLRLQARLLKVEA